MLEKKTVKLTKLNDLENIITKTSSSIFSMIGVLEHLTNSRDILKCISENENIKYLYISVLVFSYSVFFEILNENYFNRHLSGGHTHLYTNESINYLANEFEFEIVSKWQFGADALDLYRFNLLGLKK